MICMNDLCITFQIENLGCYIHDLRIFLIAAQKNYVLDAPLGDRTIADADVMNVLTKARYDDYLIV